jgi:predicted DNA-binding transcriptional regulator YafY
MGNSQFNRLNILNDLLHGNHIGFTAEELLKQVNYKWTSGGRASISRKTLYADLQKLAQDYDIQTSMASGRPGNRIKYLDPTQSIKKEKLSNEEKQALLVAFEMIERMSGIPDFDRHIPALTALRDILQPAPQNNIIAFSEHTITNGLQLIPRLYDAILKGETLTILHKPRNGFAPTEIKAFYPQLLKEYNNRWFLVGNTKIFENTTVPVDAITSLEINNEKIGKADFDFQKYYTERIGVSSKKNYKSLITIKIVIPDPNQVQYIVTKPIHNSQSQILADENNIYSFTLKLVPNEEFYQKILSYGSYITIKEPLFVVEEIKRRLDEMTKQYNVGINSKENKNV